VVHRKRHIQQLESVRFTAVDLRKTHVSCPLLSRSGSNRPSFLQLVVGRVYSGSSLSPLVLLGVIEHSLARQSSGTSNKFLTQIQLIWHISFSTSRTLENKMPTHYSLLSLFSSAINLILSATSSLPVIQPTNVVPKNPMIAHSHNASKT